ncbi:Rrf2 family transcriptional regulator [bacterium]|nr:MAG: Rrf2 family transcriptional regulator [bacterium]
MKMSEGVEWAIHCVAILATIPPDATLPAKTLAEYHGVSETYLLKHLKSLAAAGILQSVPGPKGGYRLGREADAISLLDVVEAVEGKESAFRCSEIRQRGPICLTEPGAYRLPCAIHVAMLQAEVAWKKSLQAQNIGDLARHLKDTLDPRLLADSAEWLGNRVRI